MNLNKVSDEVKVTIDPKASIIAKDYFALVLEFGNINSINSQNSNKINSSLFDEYPRLKNFEFYMKKKLQLSEMKSLKFS